MGVLNAPLVIYNGHISATGDPIQSMFGSRIGFLGSVGLLMKIYSGIARFPCGSTAFFL